MAPCIRHNTLKALRHLVKKKGTSLSEVIADEIEENGLGAWLTVASKFTVRESKVSGIVDHEHNHRHSHESVSETSQWIEEVLRADEESPAKEPRTH